MEMILFIGIPGSGKSSFYKEQFFNSHMRISLDLLNTKNRETKLLEFCFNTSMPLVLDNTNVSVADRDKYITLAKKYQYRIRGYYFKSDVTNCLLRNTRRTGKSKVPEVAILSKYKTLELPSLHEGFDELFYVEGVEENRFIINEWKNEI